MDSLEVDDEQQHLYFLNMYICIFYNLNHNSNLKIHICVGVYIYTHTYVYIYTYTHSCVQYNCMTG